jgi:hypothetical protein
MLILYMIKVGNTSCWNWLVLEYSLQQVDEKGSFHNHFTFYSWYVYIHIGDAFA